MTTNTQHTWTGDRSRPLDGIVVADFSSLLPGPYATMLLADLGARVIKIERPPDGDPTRLQEPEIFAYVNRGKQSVVLDLRKPRHHAVARAIVSRADVLVEAFRPGVASRLGLAYDEVRKLNEQIVYCSISGYGQQGPYRLLPGHDINYLATAGWLASGRGPISGHSTEAVPVGDLSSGALATVAILGLLLAGHGGYIDCSITDTLVTWLGVRGDPEALRRERGGVDPGYGVFRASDGQFIALAAIEDHFWGRLMDALGIDDHPEPDPAVALRSRREHGDELNRLIAARIVERPAHAWIESLAAHDIPVSIVNTAPELTNDPQLSMRPPLRDGSLRQPASVFAGDLEGHATQGDRQAPTLNQHGELIRKEARGWTARVRSAPVTRR